MMRGKDANVEVLVPILPSVMCHTDVRVTSGGSKEGAEGNVIVGCGDDKRHLV